MPNGSRKECDIFCGMPEVFDAMSGDVDETMATALCATVRPKSAKSAGMTFCAVTRELQQISLECRLPSV